MLKTRWETIRDDVAEMLADGVPLEDITGKLEKLKNEYQKPMTNEEWFCGLSTEEKADLLAELVWWIHPSVQGGRKVELTKESFLRWLKEKHHE